MGIEIKGSSEDGVGIAFVVTCHNCQEVRGDGGVFVVGPPITLLSILEQARFRFALDVATTHLVEHPDCQLEIRRADIGRIKQIFKNPRITRVDEV